MCLRFVFLLITRTATWLGLSRREETWRIAEILILRHQLVVLQRRQPGRPGLNWADRALLAILLGVLPKARRQGLRLLVTPDTILRWHRDIVRRRSAARSMRGKTGRPATRRNIKTLVLLWVPKTYATRRYSWITPPTRSRRRTRMWSRSVTSSGSGRSGAAWFRVRCGRCVL